MYQTALTSKRADRVVWRYLKKNHRLKPSQLPAVLTDRAVARSRKGVMGQIIVRRYSGVIKNRTVQMLKDFMERTGESREAMATTMKASKTVPKGVVRLADMLLDPRNSRTSIARLVAESGADVADMIEHYSRGAAHLRKWEAIAMAANHLPHAMRELIRLAMPRKLLCRTCLGSGKVRKQSNYKTPTEPCQTCKETGWEGEMPKDAQFSMDKILQISGLIQANEGLHIQQSMQVGVKVEGRLMERIVGLSDPHDVIEALPSEAPRSVLTEGDRS